MAFRTFTSKEVEPAAKANGLFFIHWNLVENILDVWQTVIFQNANGVALTNKMVWPLSQKLDFLEKNLRENSLLGSYADFGLNIVEEIRRISETRHTLSHFHVSRFDPETNTLEFSALKLHKPATEHRHSVAQIPAQKILDDAIACESLHPRMLKLANDLIDEFVR